MLSTPPANTRVSSALVPWRHSLDFENRFFPGTSKTAAKTKLPSIPQATGEMCGRRVRSAASVAPLTVKVELPAELMLVGLSPHVVAPNEADTLQVRLIVPE